MKRTFSKEEAQQIFAAAADRQQASQREAGERLTFEEMEEAAAAAGIDPIHVRAAAEHLILPEHAGSQRRFLGMPLENSRSTVLSFAVDDAEWSRMVEELRAVFKKRGVATEVGAVREWMSESDDRRSPVRVTAAREGDATRLTIERSRWHQTAGLSGGALSVLFTAVILVMVALATGESDLFLPAMIMAVLGPLFGMSVVAGTRASTRRDDARFDEAFRRIRKIGEKRTLSPSALRHQTARGRVTAEAPLEDSLPDRASGSGAPAEKLIDLDAEKDPAAAEEARLRARRRDR